MIHTRICALLGITHPIVLGGKHQKEAGKACIEAARAGDADNAPLLYGQDAGLIDSVLPVAQIIERIVSEADAIMRNRLQGLLRS